MTRPLLLLLLALWSIAAGAQAVDEAQALIGHEYAPLLDNELVHPDLSCKSMGAGPIQVKYVDQPGWERGQFDCNDKVLYTLERSTPRPDGGIARLKIIDALIIPGASYNNEHKPGVTVFAEDGTCVLDGKDGTSFIAKVNWGQRTRVNWKTGVLAAWTYDLKRGKIVPISPKRVVCELPEV